MHCAINDVLCCTLCFVLCADILCRSTEIDSKFETAGHISFFETLGICVAEEIFIQIVFRSSTEFSILNKWKRSCGMTIAAVSAKCCSIDTTVTSLAKLLQELQTIPKSNETPQSAMQEIRGDEISAAILHFDALDFEKNEKLKDDMILLVRTS